LTSNDCLGVFAEDIMKTIGVILDKQSQVLHNVSSQYKIKKQLVNHCGLVLPKEVVLGFTYEEDLMDGAETVNRVKATAQFVPFKESLVQLLSNKEVFDMIMKEEEKIEDGVLRSAKDGQIYLNHPIVRKYKNSLIFEMYEDDCEFVNPLGSHVKTHKMTNIYWSLLNLPPEVRSALKSIFLLGCMKAKYIKEFGFEAVLKDFISAIIELESDAGLTLNIHSKDYVFHGTLLCGSGDGLALNWLGGFKEAIGLALKPCRNCKLTREEMESVFLECDMPLRNLQDHNEQLAKVMDPSLTQKERDTVSTDTGIVKSSVLSKIKSFDITTCLPQDGMHNLVEGILERHLRKIIYQFIEVDEIMSYEDLNRRIKTFPIPNAYIDNKPSIIDRKHVTDGTLRQSASQLLCLLVIMPFIFADVVEEDNLFFQNYQLLSQICQNLLAYEVKKESIPMLQTLISIHNQRFKHHYGRMIPKCHFATHAPSVIVNFGPTRETWTMRYEARHAWFAKVASASNNFKNLEKTLATRHQIHKCVDFHFGDHNAQVLGDKLFKIVPGKVVESKNYVLGKAVRKLFNQTDEVTLNGVSTAFFKNFEIKLKSILLVKNTEHELPQFGKVSAMFVNGKKLAIVLNLFETETFSYARNAYEVSSTTRYKCVLANEMLTLQNFPLITVSGKSYVVLTYFNRIQWY
jgi:hypothetical protein